MAILNTCDISFQFSVAIDVFLVGGGASGGKGYSNAAGGAGGSGGETILIENFKPITSQTYPMIIGSSDNNTTGFNKIARSGYGSAGGGGGECYGNNHNAYPSAGAQGVVAFNGSNETGLNLLPSSYRNVLYGAGGGGADCVNSLYVWSTGDGSNAGGLTGGGEGGFDPNGGQDAIGKSGLPNTGGGGGGGCGNGAMSYYFSGGSGGSGIILIRDAR